MDKATTSPLARYIEHLRRGELAYQFDAAANAPIFPPRVIGPRTGNPELEWRVSAGLGTVYATTVNHPRETTTYNVALIDLDEGFRMMSRVEGVPPDEVKVGMRVKLVVSAAEGEAAPLPVFHLLETAL